MDTNNTQTISGQLAQYATNLQYDDLPDDVRKKAHLVLLDTLGCVMAGAGTQEMAQIRRAVSQATGEGVMRVIGARTIKRRYRWRRWPTARRRMRARSTTSAVARIPARW